MKLIDFTRKRNWDIASLKAADMFCRKIESNKQYTPTIRRYARNAKIEIGNVLQEIGDWQGVRDYFEEEKGKETE